MCIDGKQRGVSLIELVMLIVIVSIALTGIMLVTNQTSAHSADTMLRKQALAAVESLLEEIEARPFAGVCNNSSRQNFTCVSDYDGYSTSGVFDMNGTAITGLGGFDVTVSVASGALGIVPAGSAVQITVTVMPPVGAAVTLNGYRTAY